MPRVFVLGVPGSGKSAAARHLRATTNLVVLDMDDEVVRLNGGAWPTIEAKNAVLAPRVLDAATALDDVILFNSYSLLDWTHQLRRAGFTVVLLDVPSDEQQRRDEARLAEEGWTNREWFAWHRDVVTEHRDLGLFDVVVDATRPVDEVAAELAALALAG